MLKTENSFRAHSKKFKLSNNINFNIIILLVNNIDGLAVALRNFYFCFRNFHQNSRVIIHLYSSEKTENKQKYLITLLILIIQIHGIRISRESKFYVNWASLILIVSLSGSVLWFSHILRLQTSQTPILW